MTNKAIQIYKDLPSWAKGTVVVGGLAVTYFAARGIWKQIKKNIDAQDALKEVAKQQEDLRKLKSQGIVPSFLASQYLSWADQIHNQFDGCDWAETIGEYTNLGLGGVAWSGSGKLFRDIIAKMKNDADVVTLNTAYKVRTHSNCWQQVLWGVFGGATTDPLTLPMAVSDELKNSEIKGINKIMASKGIKFTY